MKGFAFLALSAAGVFWGLGFPLGKLVLRETDAAHLVLLRFAVAALAALPFALLRRDVRALFLRPSVITTGVLYGVGFLVQFEGLARTSVALSALLVGAMPALIAILGRLMGERVSRLSWVGVGAATLGAVVIAGKPGDAGSPLGVGLMLIALAFFLAWLVALRRTPAPPTIMAIPATTVIIGALTVLPLSYALHGAPKLDLSPVAWVAIVAQGLLSTFAATAAWQFGLRHVGSASAGVFVNIEPLMGATLGVMLFGDRLTPTLIAGGALIVAGSLVTVLGERKPEVVTPA